MLFFLATDLRHELVDDRLVLIYLRCVRLHGGDGVEQCRPAVAAHLGQGASLRLVFNAAVCAWRYASCSVNYNGGIS